MPRIIVSIVALNNLALTKRCLDSVLKSSSPEDVGLVLTNNGSTDGTRQYFETLAKKQNITVQHFDHNTGFQEPNKIAFDLAVKAGAELFVLLNNDTVVPAGWLDKLEAPFNEFPKAALSGPMTGCSELLPNFHGRVGVREYIEGSCLMVNVDLVREHGLFWSELVGAYGEDSDLSLRMREQGYTLHWVPLQLQHARGATSAMVPQAKGWQMANHIKLCRRWAHYLRVRKMEYPIIVRRRAAWGDVLLVTPLLRALRKMRPLSPIWVETDCTDVFRGNPHVHQCARQVFNTPDSLNVNLDMSYEGMTETHIVDAYVKHAEGAIGQSISLDSMALDIYPAAEDRAWRKKQVTDLLGDAPKPLVVVFPGPVSWASKEWGMPKFAAVIDAMIGDGWNVILVGAQRGAPLRGTIDLRNKTTIHQLAAVLECASLFVGLDSFPLHLAQAVGCPALGIFGITSSKYILTAPNARGVDSKADTAGLRHRTLHAVEVKDDGAAMSAISVNDVLAAIAELTAGKISELEMELPA